MLGFGGRACFTLLVGVAAAVLGPAGENGCASGRKEYLDDDVAAALLCGGETDEDDAPAAGSGLMARTESDTSGETLRPDEDEADEDMAEAVRVSAVDLILNRLDREHEGRRKKLTRLVTRGQCCC